jgi:hypothetical protein
MPRFRRTNSCSGEKSEAALDPVATIRKFRIVQLEAKREVTRLVGHYNLDVILAVGY